eukprot:CAMPEP_0167776808 /NCGR_PEP_ID=MMETSP0111_2-20121227/3331_1 /TAXON_ID=91324 /ORGANISM="Lotharella globosa, Strain CCCM811" /LENGTH=157 /DNA_ID=CAMNT_0007666897 /DNA_START=417 /DNA_END=890 /DNA_ORIENTATION=+
MPAQLEPFLLGAGTQVPFAKFIIAAIPAKILQGCGMAGIGMEAESLLDALGHHSGSPLQIAILVVGGVLTAILMGAMAYFFRKELRRLGTERVESQHEPLELSLEEENEVGNAVNGQSVSIDVASTTKISGETIVNPDDEASPLLLDSGHGTHDKTF